LTLYVAIRDVDREIIAPVIVKIGCQYLRPIPAAGLFLIAMRTTLTP
jgi:hypothetical protein